MDEFIHRIVNSLTVTDRRLSVVKNPDSFLCAADIQQKVLSESGLLLLPVASAFELRIRYELEDRDTSNSVCYITNDIDSILPDIKSQLFIAPAFTICKLLPAYDESVLLHSRLTIGMAAYLFSKKLTHTLSKEETHYLLDSAESLYSLDISDLSATLETIPLSWNRNETMEQICSVLLKVIERGAYEQIVPVIEGLNAEFQSFINDKYLSYINSSFANKPKMVHKILPYLTHKHNRMDKVALIVVDGMSYWQYLLLDAELNKKGIATKKDITFAWLPSITKLSRQAIFRGEAPKSDYRQSPESECRLWIDYWTSSQRNASKRMQQYEVEYTHGSVSSPNLGTSRITFVDVRLDEKMHTLDSNKDLYDLTKNWAKEVAGDIININKQGYQIYITTDHGNVLANPWRTLTLVEKTYLYEKESRGTRHLIYNNEDYLNAFMQSNSDIRKQLFVNHSWAVWRNNNSFSNKKGITHGGAHFLEVIIPFITIEKP